MGLKFGFSQDVIDNNVQFLMDQGRSEEEAKRIAEKQAELSRQKRNRASKRRK